MQGSVDGRFVLIQNVTPATSITVVDVKSGKVTGEVANPGCYGIYPSATAGARFATLCGDGTVRGYTLDKAGRKAEIKASAKVFDADKDALFVHAEPDGTSLLFVSFKGDIYRISVDGDVPTLVETIPMTAGTEGDWRPGGYQPIAFDAKTGILYALMHKGGTEGSHKNPAEEIWAFDVKSKKILARSPSQLATSLTILPGDAPALFAVNPIDVSIIRYEIEPGGGVKEGKVSKVGEAVVQLEAK
jgi:methylamine dehydrogenase heavy chain